MGIVAVTCAMMRSLSMKNSRTSVVLTGNKTIRAPEIRSGVIVSDHLRTSAPDVYMAGDVVERRNAVTGRYFVNALWSNAVEMDARRTEHGRRRSDSA
jgi:NADPH-dependent 2,4-dienoyl-CoA reductase/sulfur reductase-like enzyme